MNFSQLIRTSLDLLSILSLSTKPILFTQVPALDTVHDKLASFIAGVPSLANPSKIKDDLAEEIFPGSNSAT